MSKSSKFRLKYQEARHLWENGHIQEAEETFRKLLRKEGSDPSCVYDLGVLLLQKGEYQEAASLLKKATLLLPTFSPAFNNLGLAQQACGQDHAALQAFSRAIELDPVYSSALFNRAILQTEIGAFNEALLDLGLVCGIEPYALDAKVMMGRVLAKTFKIDRALEIFDQAILTGAPEDQILIEKGNIFLQSEQFDKAIILYTKALKINPNSAVGHYQLGLAHVQLGEKKEGSEFICRACELDSCFTMAFKWIGKFFLSNGDFEAAINILQHYVGLESDSADVFLYLAEALKAVGKISQAAIVFESAAERKPSLIYPLSEALRIHLANNDIDRAHRLAVRAMELQPDDPTTMADYAAAMRAKGDLGAALRLLQAARRQDPSNIAAMMNLGQLYMDLGQWEDASALFSKVLEQDFDNAAAAFNQGIIDLTLGKFHRGWVGYEQRTKVHVENITNILNVDLVRQYAQFSLSPGYFLGKRVLLVEEQGVGDNIMFASIIPDLLEVASHVAIITTDRLESLYRISFPKLATHLVGSLTADLISESFDLVTLVGSLGYSFRRSISDFPATPYLVAPANKSSEWERRFRMPNKKLIGVSWRGGANNLATSGRSIDLESLAPILCSPNVVAVNLQFGDTHNEIDDFAQRYGVSLLTPSFEETFNIEGLATLVSALDAVVTVQNTNVHISGAIGKECHAILPSVPEWRYGIEPNKMCWYDSVRLYRRSDATQLIDIVSHISENLGLS